ncbi:MAG: polyprenol monophosphomannose synthase [bacterium]
MKTVVVIPTYNEKENIEKLVPQILNLDKKIDVLVVDDNSPDGTGDMVDKLKAEFQDRVFVIHRAGKLGFASAYIEGFQFALNLDVDYIISMDADFSHNPKYLPELIERFKDYDVVVGSRYMHGTVSVVNWPIKRLVLSKLANLYAKIVTGLKVNDCTSGFTGYKREVLEKIGIRNILSDGYSFLIEMKYLAQKKGYKLVEVPIIFEERRLGQSKMSKKIMFEALLIVWRLRFGFFLLKTLDRIINICYN